MFYNTKLKCYEVGLSYFWVTLVDSSFMGGSTPTTAFDGAIWNFAFTMYRREEKQLQNDSYGHLDNLIPYMAFVYDSAVMGRSAPTTAFNGAIWIFADTM